MSALDDLAAHLRAEEGLLAQVVTDPPAGVRPEHGVRAAAGDPGYALLVEAIREGYLQHYGEGRVLRGDDEDLALLAGDHLYAFGLERLADRGDLESVVVLAELIASCAQAHAEGRPGDAEEAWRRGAAAIAARAGAV